MKTNIYLIMLAVFAIALFTSCQKEEVVTTDIATHKEVAKKAKPSTPTPTYDVSIEVRLTPEWPYSIDFTGVEGVSRRKNINVRWQELYLNVKGLLPLAQTWKGDWDKCFTGIEGKFDRSPLALDMGQEKDLTKASAGYWFSGYDDTGKSEVKYQLILNGNINGDWRPGPDLSTTTIELTTWEMTASRRVKNTCTGSGTFGDGDVIRYTRNPPPSN